ncbi:MAG: ATP-binding protein [Firmicutes bacterium]|nr:ATP-binding protein [Bacillota bacterium]
MRDKKLPLHAVLRLARDAAGVAAVHIVRYDPWGQRIVPLMLAASAEVNGKMTTGAFSHAIRLMPGGTALTSIYHDGRPYCGSLDVVWRELDSFAASLAQDSGWHHGLVVPITMEGLVWGSVSFYHERPLTLEQVDRCRMAILLIQNYVTELGNARNARRLQRAALRIGAGIAQAEDKLRREIAEELHGTVQTKLLMVWHELKRCQESVAPDGDMAQRLGRLGASLEAIREDDVRRLSHRLNPGMIRIALRPAIRHLVSCFGSCMDVDIEEDPEYIRCDSALDNQIPEPVRLAVYRVVEESLLNAVRHGKAVRSLIQFTVNGDHLTVSVKDEGHGFQDHRRERGMGMELMETRVRAVGGTLHVTSAPNEGTTIRIRVPLSSTPRPSEAPPQLVGF